MNLRHRDLYAEQVAEVTDQIKRVLAKMYLKQHELYEKRGYKPEIGCYKIKQGKKKMMVRTMYSGYFKWRTIGTVVYPIALDKYINFNEIPGWLDESTTQSEKD